MNKMAKDFSYEIKENIGVLAESAKGWKKELNLISWNGAEPKLDVREWSPDHAKMGKGITLTNNDAKKLMALLDDYFSK